MLGVAVTTVALNVSQVGPEPAPAPVRTTYVKRGHVLPFEVFVSLHINWGENAADKITQQNVCKASGVGLA